MKAEEGPLSQGEGDGDDAEGPPPDGLDEAYRELVAEAGELQEDPGPPAPEAPLVLPGPFPIEARRADIVRAVRENRVTLLQADTASGRSLTVPRWLLGAAPSARVFVAQPDAFAADVLAQRTRRALAAEARRGGGGGAERAGQRGGGEGDGEEAVEGGGAAGARATPPSETGDADLVASCTAPGQPFPDARAVFCTAGALLQYLARPSGARACDAAYVVLDDLPRSAEADLLLLLLRRLLPRRPGLRLVVMSAMPDAALWAEYLGAVQPALRPLAAGPSHSGGAADSEGRAEGACGTGGEAQPQSESPVGAGPGGGGEGRAEPAAEAAG